MRSLSLFFCAVWLCGFFPATASAETLSSDEIVKLLSGATVETLDQKGRTIIMTFKSDGTVAGELVKKKSSDYDDGKWSTEKNGLFCLQWERLKRGEKKCNFLLLQKDGKTLKRREADGSVRRNNWFIK